MIHDGTETYEGRLPWDQRFTISKLIQDGTETYEGRLSWDQLLFSFSSLIQDGTETYEGLSSLGSAANIVPQYRYSGLESMGAHRPLGS